MAESADAGICGALCICCVGALGAWCNIKSYGAGSSTGTCCGGPRGCCGSCLQGSFDEDDFEQAEEKRVRREREREMRREESKRHEGGQEQEQGQQETKERTEGQDGGTGSPGAGAGVVVEQPKHTQAMQAPSAPT